MKIVIDKDIPFIKGVIEPFADVVYKEGRDISSSDLVDADAMIIRTRTICNESLLHGSTVKFIASATIGRDHVDIDYCKRNNIFFTNAAGCNAWGVVQYVLTSIFTVSHIKHFNICGKTIGIIGAGNVGERLAWVLEMLGFNIMRCDPPVRAILESGQIPKGDLLFSYRSALRTSDYYSMEEVLKNSDIVTLHLPLDCNTLAMLNDECFSLMKPGCIFINSSRGEVLDEESLVSYSDKLGAVIIDVWSNEPNISLPLLSVADIATPHIAGYSLEGKINATVMSVNALGNFFGIESLSGFKIGYPPYKRLSGLDDKIDDVQEWIFRILYESFPVYETDLLLRKDPLLFEKIRSGYVYRREVQENLYKEIANKIKFNSYV